ncbi:MAG: 4Fe-4S binding protein [Rhodospirillales bacterium]|nr:4Fe-4S binding protein [Rhodospirillales bacterium]
MALKIITSDCTVCGTCEFDCPNSAIRMKSETYVIDPAKCTECVGFFDSPNCVAGCPADCIVPA